MTSITEHGNLRKDDKEALKNFCKAVCASASSIRLDSAGDPCLFGRYGYVLAQAEHGTFSLVIANQSHRNWNLAKLQLEGIAKLVQNGEDEGIHVMSLPDREHARVIKRVLGLQPGKTGPTRKSFPRKK